ncbi:fumarate reductase/succinate dehydrogenase flavoprotein domain-containing protein [Deinococcus aerius]|uniref:Fumarate reductase/succinate dehydrogenase flavoprotein domain-containing protein n=1 Tax=Deinococcus aerius TaxID=200253 RepID=A0A2I9CZY8_9DEIO|nr:FAD-dependent oxidoreductase [Deinococcus aerius]GBF07833.1 fumarate reductase/succinate dehydrogenase flavoprotein domain-containing protein [Deinococcus aerius]
MGLEYRASERRWDVIVAGGGTSGAIAGIASARAGARTLIVEAFGSLGGTGTNAQVTPLMRNVSAGVSLNQGLTEELKARLIARGDGAVDRGGNDNWFNPEGMKYVLEQMAVESGAELLYHTHVVQPVLDGGNVRGLVVHNKGGLVELPAKVIIDSTGDADVAVAAGAPFQAGGEDGLHQAMSLRFTLAGVDPERLCAFLIGQGQPQESPRFLHFWMVWGKNSTLEPLFRQAVEDGVLLERDGDYFQGFSVPGRPGEISFNCPRLAPELNDGADPWQLSAAQVDGKAAVERLVHFCRRYLPGCEASFLGSYAPMVGIRETRRIVGDYVLTLEDILDCRTFEDAICRNHYPVDIHSPRGKKLYHEREGQSPYFRPDAYHEIPYRALIPRGLRNVLVPGRCASATFEAQSAIRVQQNCHSMGEAAGLAAAWASRNCGDVRGVDGVELRAALRAQGANL